MRKTRVKDLMTNEVVTLEKGQAVPLAQELMRMLIHHRQVSYTVLVHQRQGIAHLVGRMHRDHAGCHDIFNRHLPVTG